MRPICSEQGRGGSGRCEREYWDGSEEWSLHGGKRYSSVSDCQYQDGQNGRRVGLKTVMPRLEMNGTEPPGVDCPSLVDHL
jgi:hypothetical protein